MPSNHAASIPAPLAALDDQENTSSAAKTLAVDAEETSDCFGTDASQLDIIPWS